MYQGLAWLIKSESSGTVWFAVCAVSVSPLRLCGDLSAKASTAETQRWRRELKLYHYPEIQRSKQKEVARWTTSRETR